MGEFFYREVSPGELDPGLLDRARVMLDYCKKTLGLHRVPLRIRWIAEISEGAYQYDAALKNAEELCYRLAGKHYQTRGIMHRNPDSFSGQAGGGLLERGILTVRADIPEREILLTIAHECQHAADYEVYRPPWTEAEKAAWERHAKEFERKALAELRAMMGWSL